MNYSTSGRKEHFYQISPTEKCIKVFKKQGNKAPGSIFLTDIKKCVYGVFTENVKKKFVSMQNAKLNIPWLFFSILTEKRSIDFYIEEKDLIVWYYGIKKFLEINDESDKLISVSGFLLQKLKMKMIYQLNEELKKQVVPDKNLMKFSKLINNKNNGKLFFIIIIVKDIFKTPFTSILLLYLKIKKIKI